MAHERAEKVKMRRAVEEGLACEIMPWSFARKDYWCRLKPAARARHRIRALHECEPGIVFAGASAALVHGLTVSNRHLRQTWVATSRKTHRRSDDNIKCIIVSADDFAKVDGLRVTSLERTLYDCLRIMDFRSALTVADSALRLRSLAAGDLASRIETTYRNARDLRRVRATVLLADGRSESGGESIARATMLELGLATPDLQRSLSSPLDPRRVYRVDYAWDVVGGVVLGELDGNEKYLSTDMRGQLSIAQVIEREHRRQSYIEAIEGVLRMIRFGFSDVMDDRSFLRLLMGCGVPRTFALDKRVVEARGILRCR